jgi:flagellar biogenesis protein FliO
MGAFLFAFIAFVALLLLIIVGFVICMRLYTHRAFGTGRFRRIRRVRARPDSPVIEEVIEEEVPAEDQS